MEDDELEPPQPEKNCSHCDRTIPAPAAVCSHCLTTFDHQQPENAD
jgi:predicted amidophosphoribosyltransferase